MHVQFNQRRVLVTGSTSGIGFAAARAYLAAGAHVVINGRSEASVSAALARLGHVPEVEGFAGDLATQAACERLFEAHPSFDIVVNNLGIYGPEDFFVRVDGGVVDSIV